MSNAFAPDYYALLHVQQDAPLPLIKASYRIIMQVLKSHPDLGGDTEHAIQLNLAYSVLSNPKKRQAYDYGLQDNEQMKTLIAPGPKKTHKSHQQDHCLFCQTFITHSTSSEECLHCGSPLFPYVLLKEKNIATNTNDFQRALTRLPKEGNIIFHTTWPGEGIAAKLRDISPLGLSFLTSSLLSSKQRIKIETTFFYAIAEVSYCSHNICGARFLTLKFQKNRGNFLSIEA